MLRIYTCYDNATFGTKSFWTFVYDHNWFLPSLIQGLLKMIVVQPSAVLCLINAQDMASWLDSNQLTLRNSLYPWRKWSVQSFYCTKIFQILREDLKFLQLWNNLEKNKLFFNLSALQLERYQMHVCGNEKEIMGR